MFDVLQPLVAAEKKNNPTSAILLKQMESTAVVSYKASNSVEVFTVIEDAQKLNHFQIPTIILKSCTYNMVIFDLP